MANCNGREALRMYRQKYPSRKMPSRSFFATIHRRLWETGSLDVHKPDSGRQQISRTVDAEERVVHALQRNPSTKKDAKVEYEKCSLLISILKRMLRLHMRQK
ncbi:hypothetical protein TNCT_702731 [Trichonephila clavata]|uniref:DUF4817 domain-containing protein n=1 Tax=Trichonephila clavata TaxID=2740835 RepID=A0A8X6IYW7_TRICU|nr:hypothetical protein TNCT_702731 [Trichonephila clavata]